MPMLLTAAACATAPMPPAPPAPPLSYPPAARARLLAIAEAEWRDWGALDAGEAYTPPGRESEAQNFPRVLAYWAAVPDGAGVIATNRRRYAATLATGSARPAVAPWADPPWSAAFISYVLRGAGLDPADAPGDASHARIIDALLGHAVRYPAHAPFVPHAPAERAAAPGDVLCGDRSAAPLAHWRERLDETGRFRPMHCDIVVGVEPGQVLAIGGNLGDAVVRRRFQTDASGRLAPSAPGAAPLILLLENRLGRLPPWSP